VADIPWTVQIDRTLYERATQRAQVENEALEQVVRRLLTEWISTPSPAYQTYTIRSGDSLAQIAARFYGDAKLYAPLAEFNRITDVTQLRVGQTIRIPPRNALTEPNAGVPTTTPDERPPPLKIEFVQSPHHNRRPNGTRIWAIVIHATANSTVEGVIDWFTDPRSEVCAHYVIGKKGRVVQMAREDQRAWHAGESIWKDVPDVNDYSIGIELVNKNDGVDPYPKAQLETCVRLCKNLVRQYGIETENIMGHRDISLTGKTDPAGFDLDQLRRGISAALQGRSV
jgi:hypothetical protein